MEVKNSCNILKLINKGDNELRVVVEYLHYVEDVAPGQCFKIEVSSSIDNDLSSLFEIEYHEQKINIFLNTKIDFLRKHTVSFWIDDNCVYSQDI